MKIYFFDRCAEGFQCICEGYEHPDEHREFFVKREDYITIALSLSEEKVFYASCVLLQVKRNID